MDNNKLYNEILEQLQEINSKIDNGIINIPISFPRGRGMRVPRVKINRVNRPTVPGFDW